MRTFPFIAPVILLAACSRSDNRQAIAPAPAGIRSLWRALPRPWDTLPRRTRLRAALPLRPESSARGARACLKPAPVESEALDLRIPACRSREERRSMSGSMRLSTRSRNRAGDVVHATLSQPLSIGRPHRDSRRHSLYGARDRRRLVGTTQRARIHWSGADFVPPEWTAVPHSRPPAWSGPVRRTKSATAF